MSKFSYFDFIAYIVPGALLLGVLSLLVGSSSFIRISGNAAIDTLLFAVISFVIGGFIHQLSNHLIEPLVKRLFWNGKFYSEIYLVKRYGLCKDPLRSQIITNAESLFRFDKVSLASLDLEPTIERPPDPHVVSHQICRRFDHFTLDHNLAQKGHTANVLYSLYRTMTLTMLVLVIIFAVSYGWHTSDISSTSKVILAASSFIGSILFLIRTRNEGQRYVEGVLSSVSEAQFLSEMNSGN